MSSSTIVGADRSAFFTTSSKKLLKRKRSCDTLPLLWNDRFKMYRYFGIATLKYDFPYFGIAISEYLYFSKIVILKYYFLYSTIVILKMHRYYEITILKYGKSYTGGDKFWFWIWGCFQQHKYEQRCVKCHNLNLEHGHHHISVSSPYIKGRLCKNPCGMSKIVASLTVVAIQESVKLWNLEAASRFESTWIMNHLV